MSSIIIKVSAPKSDDVIVTLTGVGDIVYEPPEIKLTAVKCHHCGGVIYLNPKTGEQDKSP